MNVITEIEKDLPPVDSIPNSGVAEVPSRVAQELKFWTGLKETDGEAKPRLAQYWSGSGWQPDEWTPSGTPWSAVFISHLVRGSGFEPSASHYGYTESILSGKSPGWKAYSIPKNLSQIKLNPGDILIKPRGSGGAPGTDGHYRTHGDIVYRIDGSPGQALLVGGNVGDTAKIVGRINVDADGKPTQSLHPYVVILKREKKSGMVKYLLGAISIAGLVFLWTRK